MGRIVGERPDSRPRLHVGKKSHGRAQGVRCDHFGQPIRAASNAAVDAGAAEITRVGNQSEPGEGAGSPGATGPKTAN